MVFVRRTSTALGLHETFASVSTSLQFEFALDSANSQHFRRPVASPKPKIGLWKELIATQTMGPLVVGAHSRAWFSAWDSRTVHAFFDELVALLTGAQPKH